MELAKSLRNAVQLEGSTGAQQDSRFLFGTEVSSNYKQPPPEAYEVWKPLPVSHLQAQATQAGKHLISQSAIFPRLSSSFEEAKAKLLPKLTEFLAACKRLDVEGEEGVLSDEEVAAAVKETVVFMSSADLAVLLPDAPRVPSGLIKYKELSDLLLGQAPAPGLQLTPSGICAGRPTLPTTFSWPEGQGFDVRLRLRSESSPFTIEPSLMDKYAKRATELRRIEQDAEKVHAMLRHGMLMDLVVEAGRPGRPSLAFRQWLAGSGVMSLTMCQHPGPIVPEVYDCLDQVIYDALGFPKVVPTTQVLTSLQSTMRGTTKLSPSSTATAATSPATTQ